MSDFWQAPGNGKGFDSYLGDNSKMNNRTIGALTYIKEKSETLGYVNKEQFSKEIKAYLQKNFNEDPNSSLETHFFRPALFYGFLHINKDDKLSLSIEGNLFLNNYAEHKYQECKKLIINQLDNTIYPNNATQRIKNLKLFPFRILFKLLLENREIDSNFITMSLVHIKSIGDLDRYMVSHKLTDIKSYTESSTKYKKFNTWVINSLVDLEILELKNRKISIAKDVLEHIKLLYNGIEYVDMFFDNISCDLNEKVAEKRVKRDQSLIQDAKKRDKFMCGVNNEHVTFISKGNNYVEGHHIIPMYQQKNYTFKLDNLDNIISLCPNCHREIHSADNKTEILNRLYAINNTYMTANNIKLYDLHKMYSCI